MPVPKRYINIFNPRDRHHHRHLSHQCPGRNPALQDRSGVKHEVRLKKAVAELTQYNCILKEALEGNHYALTGVAGALSICNESWVYIERLACLVIGQPISTQCYSTCRKADEEALRSEIIKLVTRYVCYEYRRITALLRRSGWRIILQIGYSEYVLFLASFFVGIRAFYLTSSENVYLICQSQFQRINYYL